MSEYLDGVRITTIREPIHYHGPRPDGAPESRMVDYVLLSEYESLRDQLRKKVNEMRLSKRKIKFERDELRHALEQISRLPAKFKTAVEIAKEVLKL